MPEVCLAVRGLAEFLLRSGDLDSRFTGFDRALEGARIHRRLQKAAGGDYAAEVALSCRRTVAGIDYCIEGRADGIFTDETGTVTIDEIKTTAVPSAQIEENGNPCHWAQGMVYAAIYGAQQSLAALNVRLTYFQIDEEKTIRFVRHFSLPELEAYFTSLLAQYAPWAQRSLTHTAARSHALHEMAFPFSGWRPGQKAMSGEVYHACENGDVLFCQAPTGTGKTMSAMFPALKAMGAGYGSRLFYLTARTTARAAAENALQALAVPSLLSITLTAKEKACLCLNAAGRPECLPERCPFARGYYAHVRQALAAVLDGGRPLTREVLAEAAQRYSVCPFELGLDASEWCDVILCDYNYLFDPVVRLRRFFESKSDALFLVDEAHNLPDRARDMYSAAFSKSALLEAKRALGKGKSRLKTALSQANDMLLAYRKACADTFPEESGAAFFSEQTSLFSAAPAGGDAAADSAARVEALGSTSADSLLAGGDALSASGAGQNSLCESALFAEAPLSCQGGTRFYRSLPKPLLTALRRILAPAQAWLEEHREGAAHEAILQLYFLLRDFLRTAEGYDTHYVTQLSAHGAELTVSLLCLDPSEFLKKCFACGRAAVLFSATIAPPGYYRSILGCAEARAVALKSPFAPEHLGLFCLQNVSTRYRDRENSLAAITQALYAMATARRGHYLAFFPSYAYLRQAFARFTQEHPDVPTLAQESGLDDAARAAFLAHFQAEEQADTLLGFCVMGGVFGEGIDLTGGQLIGCAVVGVGLPQVSPRQEMLRRYYDDLAGCGFDFAYRFPGMNKVLQAAGRVIRTPEDEGVVLLIDDRFAQAQYRALFPPHWAHLRYCADASSLSEGLAAFWAAHP
ncbi:MAG: ATP-dependent DNA helicase [Faecalibacterium sp.]|jgi:Rad3-related DNA helicase|nr:ATP-dependent DNA helicase [Faecalibacterium sp.]